MLVATASTWPTREWSVGSVRCVKEPDVITGGAVNDNVSTREPSGVIRAFDVDTGELVWNWDPGNPQQTDPIAAGETYITSTPNSWSVSSSLLHTSPSPRDRTRSPMPSLA